jgi:glutamate-1-semialdehyde aminotransferase
VTDRDRGIPAEVAGLTSTFEYNDIDSLADALGNDVACVILEPVTFQPPRDGFLQSVQALCRRQGAVLVFDEMWTGFRLEIGGAQALYGVVPDLACFSKAVANGMPLSILAGRGEIMDLLEKDVFFYTTFGGEALSLAAAKATIRELLRTGAPLRLAEQGRKIKDGFNDIARSVGVSFAECVGLDCRTLVTFDAKAADPLEQKSLVQQELVRRGILWGGFHNVSLSHSDEDVDRTLQAYGEVLPILRDAVASGRVRDLLRGEPVGPVFRRTSGFHTKRSVPPVATGSTRP